MRCCTRTRWRRRRGWPLGALAALGRLLGDPRRGSVGLFLDLRNVFPEGYPLDDWPLPKLIRAEGRLARTLDYGIISSWLDGIRWPPARLAAFATGRRRVESRSSG